MIRYFYLLLALGCIILFADSLQAQTVLHQPKMKYVDPFVTDGNLLLHVKAANMENAVAQVVNFYERHGWGINEDLIRYSGNALIYEYAPLPKDAQPIDTKLKSASLYKTLDFLCNKTKGTFRVNLYDNRVYAIYKMQNSLLINSRIDSSNLGRIRFFDAIERVLTMANNSNRNVRIRFERPAQVRPRAGAGTSAWDIFDTLSANEINREINVNIKGRQLVHGLTSVLMAQPYPLYMTLKPDRQGSRFTHVLRLETMPDAKVTDAEHLYYNTYPLRVR